MLSPLSQLRSLTKFGRLARHQNRRDRTSMRFYIDRLNAVETIGWVVSETAHHISIDVLIDDKLIATGKTELQRNDVAPHFNFAGNSSNCGFRLTFPIPLANRTGAVPVAFKFTERDSADNILGQAEHRELFFGPQKGGGHFTGPATPFPAAISGLLWRFWGEQFSSADFADSAVQVNAMERIRLICSHSDTGTFEDLIAYQRYLNQCWSHFQFIGRHFPEFNLSGNPGDKDWLLKANSPEEMLSIANHLYCLKSYGVQGSLAEFGCFKGYSTSMLSFACSLLDIPMVVFDSFQGLPASGSPYYQAGEFSGSLDEVKRNVERYGEIDSVNFIKGYFCDTVVERNVPPLLCLWMDVDLADSAKDVVRALPQLDIRGALFSHECLESYFGPTTITSPKGTDFVVPPILDAFSHLGSATRGRYLCGYTGSFWHANTGIPVMAHDVLMQLVRSS